MPTAKNKFGLSRKIDPQTKLQIRQNSKFGCVICRSGIITYEHIDPVMVDAKEHDSDKMCILCPNHQQESTSGVLSKKQIIEAYKRVREPGFQEPPRRPGFFNLKSKYATVKLGPTSFKGFQSIINVNGENFLSIKEDPDTNGGIVISGKFLDGQGNELFQISDNEWVGNTEQWDVDIVGRKLKIRRAKGKILFAGETNYDTNTMTITHLDMWAHPFHIFMASGLLHIAQHDISRRTWVLYGIDAEFEGGYCGLFLDARNKTELALGTWKSVGGHNIIAGTGIELARGPSRMMLKKNITMLRSPNCPVLIEISKPERKARELFVKGVLTSRIISFPDWNETVFSINGIDLENRPMSWGKIGNDSDGNSVELYHLAGTESLEFEDCDGFIGYKSDDFVDEPWADLVFNCEVIVKKPDTGETYKTRMKRAEFFKRNDINEILNSDAEPYLAPHRFQ